MMFKSPVCERNQNDHQKDFVDVQDFTKEELLEMIEMIRMLKEADQKGIQLPLLEGNTIALMFDQPSTRTRVSFESAMDKLGGWRPGTLRPKRCTWARGARR